MQRSGSEIELRSAFLVRSKDSTQNDLTLALISIWKHRVQPTKIYQREQDDHAFSKLAQTVLAYDSFFSLTLFQ